MTALKRAKIIDHFLVTDYVANGSFASLKSNVTYNYQPDHAILIRTTDNTKGWNGNYVYVNEDSYNFLNKSKLLPGDLIIANVGDPGKAFLCPDMGQPMTLGPNSILVRPLDANEVSNKYFYYYTISKEGQGAIQEICSATAQKKFNKTSYRAMEFPLPPLDEQKKIAAILDAADELRQKDKALIAKYDELTQSLFLDMFGDPLVNPKDWEKEEGAYHYEVRGRVGWKGYKKTDLRNSGPLVIGATHVNALGEVDLQKAVYLSEEKYFESPEIMVQMDDLLFVQRGNTIGKIAIVNSEIGPATINPVLLIFRPINSNPLFLLYLLMNDRIKQDVVELNSGSAQPMITQKSMKEYILINPPNYLQNQFSEIVKVIASQRRLAKESLNNSEALFNSLLQKAFKGELTN